MNLVADNLWAVVTEATPDELRWLDAYLTVSVKNAEHSEAYQNGVWDGTVRLYDKKKSRLASGLLRLVGGRAREQSIAFAVQDARVKPPATVDPAAGAWLRPYQRGAVETMIHRGRGIISLPTGAGKSELAVALAQAIRVQWLVLVDTKDLMHQMGERFFLRTGERPGLAGDGEWDPRRFTVATLQTLYRGIGDKGKVDALLNASQAVLSDEVQCVSSTEHRKVAMATPNAWYRYGISATPLEREDESDYRAIEVLGPLIVDVKPKPLIEAGYLARPDIVFVRHRHEKMSGSFPVVYEAGVVLNEKRNALAARIAGDLGLCPRPTLAFFKAIAHGRKLVKAIEPRARIEMVDGSASAGKGGRRDAVRHRLRMGLTDVLACSKIFNKGVDIPEVESGVNAAAGASRIDALQKVGRLMRVVGSKRVVRYWDFMDVGNHWLEGHARARIEAFRSREYDVRVVDEADLPTLAREKLA